MPYNPIPTFIQEAEELIADIEESALVLESGAGDAETINRLFRDFHTIKGSGAMCGLEELAGFTHHVESLLDRVRAGEIPVSESLSRVILKSADHLKVLLRAAEGGPSPSAAESASLLNSIGDVLGSAVSARTPGSGPGASHSATVDAKSERTWSIRFQPNPSLLANGGNPAALLTDLKRLGNCEIVAHDEDVPPLDEIQPDRCYLWWTATVRGACDEVAIRDVFLFVEDDSTLDIREVVTAESPRAAEEKASKGQNVASPSERTNTTKEATVRVPAERLDHLVNLVGEFVMNQSCLVQALAQNGAPEFANPVQALDRLVAELRDNVLGIRMLPIGTLFGRFRRVVHDLATELHKQADLVTEGAETELDKSILDQLGEPLVHCLRNCIDHGVEPPEERIARGKPPRATVRLSAVHTGANVLIRIEDDGRGIDMEAVRAKAIEKQLVSPDAKLGDSDIYNLILLPGFSTARQVTSVSGRGVGMDAVRRQIDLLRGSLSVNSSAGRGTTVSISLPLTLAIIEGLLVQTGDERFVLPLAAVTENVELSLADRTRRNGRNLLAVRGELIPYIDLREAFQIGGRSEDIEKVVIVRHGDERVGLVVARVLGTHQTVIQSLGKFFTKVNVVSGATIMGDGRVALIIDIPAVVRYAARLIEGKDGIFKAVGSKEKQHAA